MADRRADATPAHPLGQAWVFPEISKTGHPRDPLTVGAGRCIWWVMLVYKIFRADEWAALRRDGTSAGAPVDIADGYVHLSSPDQAPETAAKHFAGESGLFLLAVEADRLGDDLKWEPSRGGALFPHLYRELRLSDVAWAQPLPSVDGVFVFPPGAA